MNSLIANCCNLFTMKSLVGMLTITNRFLVLGKGQHESWITSVIDQSSCAPSLSNLLTTTSFYYVVNCYFVFHILAIWPWNVNIPNTWSDCNLDSYPIVSISFSLTQNNCQKDYISYSPNARFHPLHHPIAQINWVYFPYYLPSLKQHMLSLSVKLSIKVILDYVWHW